MAIFKAIAEMLGIVLLRFPTPKNLWSVLILTVNSGALIFILTIYGQIVLAANMGGIAIMTAIYKKQGFVRLLGIGHIFWVPMLIWIALNLPDKTTDPALYWWIVSLLITNSACLLVDLTDLVRYVNGDRQPHYRWQQS